MWRCLFMPCAWLFLGNVRSQGTTGYYGLYQCKHCKTVSRGAAR